MQGKVIIFSAPSGSGKSTIINFLMQHEPSLQFSISATSRPPRGQERDGVDYYFFTPEEFRQGIAEGRFVEYEEVYPDRFYGTLKSEVARIHAAGCHAIFDIDVKGAMNLKHIYATQALSVFIEPPSLETLQQRLEQRGTETPQSIATRLARARFELSYASRFDCVIVNDELATAQTEALAVVSHFLASE